MSPCLLRCLKKIDEVAKSTPMQEAGPLLLS